MSRPVTRYLRSAAAVVIKLSLVGAIGAGVFLGTEALRHRAEARLSEAQAEPAPLPVEVVRLRPESGYTVEDRFTGRLEPARRAALGFERGGLVLAILVDEGDRVAAGQTIARLDTATLEAERARLVAQREQIAAALDLARRTLARQEALEGQGHASAQRLDEARLAVAVEEARAAEIAAGIARLDVDIEKSVLSAPFSGTIGARRLDEGAIAAAGAAVVEMLESNAPRIRIGVSPDAAARLRVGAHATLLIEGAPTPARVVAVRPDLDLATRTVSALFAPTWPVAAAFGAIAELRLPHFVEEPGYWAPLAALVEGERGLWSVLVAAPGQGAGQDQGEGAEIVREAVEVLHVEGDRAFVRGTLAPGAALLAGGSHRVAPGQRVVLANAE